jgi:hypothetical protein
MKDKPKLRNPVAQHNNTFNKPQTHRDRKKESKKKGKQTDEDLRHPLHDPYVRPHKDWTDFNED